MVRFIAGATANGEAEFGPREMKVSKTYREDFPLKISSRAPDPNAAAPLSAAMSTPLPPAKPGLNSHVRR
jgi:hypothetical protein